ncbi:MAG TPA: aminopeptidase P family protein [Clostridia bacterium]|nr:aminopeptidase P family protein [Clostridia bacterium]
MIKNRINQLIQLMEEKSIDAYIIPSSDFHQSEYVANYFKSRAYISGFSGSAGTVCILKDGTHGLWTDGRYFLQAEKELNGSGIKLFKMDTEGVKNYDDWLVNYLSEKSTVAFDGRTLSIKDVENLKKKFELKDIKIKTNEDLIDLIWRDRPSLPKGKIIEHVVDYSGKTHNEKLTEIRDIMQEKNADYYILSSLDDIAWTFNLRGSDIDYNPIFLAYAVFTQDAAILYLDENKLSDELSDELAKKKIIIKGYDEIFNDVKGITSANILLSPSKVNYEIYTKIDDSNPLIKEEDLTTKMKALKNEAEEKNMENCFVRDGVAMVKFLKWLEETVPKKDITEIDAINKLSQLRSKEDLFVQDSFGYISAYQENAALPHYAAKEETCKTLKPEGFYLMDSGGQYFDGTTDITRTIALGELTPQQKKDYTLVLMGHIDLSRMSFLEGTYGSNLDIIARKPLWDHGYNYNHGTGHGVGYFLNVHEGPQRISRKPSNVTLKSGMVLSNEPGIYRQGEYGIRLENLVIVKNDYQTEFGEFMKFKNLTWCPFDLKAIDSSFMNKEQIKWLNNYHKEVYELLKDRLNQEAQEWLEEKTKPIR